MSFPDIVSALIDGALIGLIYAATGLGLALVLDMLKVINVAHGAFIMLGSYFAYGMFATFSFDPVLSLGLALPLFFFTGMLAYRALASFAQSASESQGLLAMFGLMVLIESLATVFWTNDTRALTLSYSNEPLTIGAIAVPMTRLMAGAIGLALFAAVGGFLRYTLAGRAIRAAGQNPTAAAMLGINVKVMSASVFGLGLACAAAAGAGIAIAFPIAPNTQAQWLPWAFLVAIAGAMDLAGMLTAGLIFGLLQALVTLWLPFEDVTLTLYLVLGGVLVLRRRGFSRVAARTV